MPKQRAKRRTKREFTDVEKDIMNSILEETMNNNITKLEHGKTITLSSFPECEYKKKICSIVGNPFEVKVCAIAVLSPDKKTWSAYAGYPGLLDLNMEKLREVAQQNPNGPDLYWLCENVRDAEQVAIMGDLLPEEVARKLFPDWRNKEYKQ